MVCGKKAHTLLSPRELRLFPPDPSLGLPAVLGLREHAAALKPAASQVFTHQKSSHGLEESDFSLGARKRDSRERGKLLRKGFSPGSKATGRQTWRGVLMPSFTAASPAASDSHLTSGASLTTLHLHACSNPIFRDGLSAWCDKCT